MTVAFARRVIEIAVVFAATLAMARQCRKPTGWLGRRLARAMNLGHSRLTVWGLTHATLGPRARVLDVGCGGGNTIHRLAAMAPEGHVDGLDYAPASVEIARATNADLIRTGRVAIQSGTVSHLPFADASFDLVTAVETHYYWPDLARDLREVRRVLAPRGQFLIVAETYKGRAMDWLYWPVMRVVLRARYLTLDEHRAALADAGFTRVEVHTHAAGWMCATGSRPSDS